MNMEHQFSNHQLLPEIHLNDQIPQIVISDPSVFNLSNAAGSAEVIFKQPHHNDIVYEEDVGSTSSHSRENPSQYERAGVIKWSFNSGSPLVDGKESAAGSAMFLRPNRTMSPCNDHNILGEVFAAQLVMQDVVDRASQTDWKWKVMAERWRHAKIIVCKDTAAVSKVKDVDEVSQGSGSQMEGRLSIHSHTQKQQKLQALRKEREIDKCVDTYDLEYDPDEYLALVHERKGDTRKSFRKSHRHLSPNDAAVASSRVSVNSRSGSVSPTEEENYSRRLTKGSIQWAP